MVERYGRGDDADPERDAVDPYTGAPYTVDPYTGAPYTGEAVEDDVRDVEPISGAVVAQHSTLPRGELRADFGAHLETHYPRLVAQLYAITLHPGDAHEAVQDAYSRAWRRWPEVRESEDPVGWVRRVAIRTSTRGWRQGMARLGLRRGTRPGGESVEPRTAALLDALGRLPVTDRRAIVLHHMADMRTDEIAMLERVSEKSVRDRLRRGRHVVTEGLADVLGEVVGAPPDPRAREEWPPQQWDGRYGTEDLPGERA
ncbi:sigma factor-like helix-turn-helix DNA-binding protein [Pseudonocardia sp. KRD291]|uniref:RNA polymerase sigma factor n=1 Tax=Pseudonocardia sp. KRD291 TaxID=2792007 RepID=UPI0027E229F1|nr:sigma factor-like helix-turn-helix DNA-binding protein [Pseudonocardia sp. KRD291]